MADGLCVSLYCVQGPPSPAAGAGFKEHPWREDILGKQHETDLERAGARYITYKVIISCKGDRGDLLPRVLRQTQAEPPPGQRNHRWHTQGRRRLSLWVRVRQGWTTSGLQEEQAQTGKAGDSTLFRSACVNAWL